MDLFNLKGKNVVAVGGAGGIGQAIAQGFVEAGANVIIASRSEGSLQRAVAEIKEATGIEPGYLTVDATNVQLVERAIRLGIEAGREIATPEETRQILGLKGRMGL